MTEMNENEQLYWTFEEVSEHPAIEEMVSRYIAKHREKMRKAFYFTFYKHMAA